MSATEKPERIAVVGGGIAGLYTAWRLSCSIADSSARTRRPEVTVFEAGERLGGRIRSLYLPPLRFRAELGAMRFHASHHLLRALLAEFRIPTKRFDVPAAHFRVRGRTLSAQELVNGACAHCGAAIPFVLSAREKGRTADALVVEAMTQLLQNLGFPEADYIEAQHYRRQIQAGAYSGELWDFVRRHGSYQDIRLRDIGFLNLLQHYLSNEAFQLVLNVFSLESVLANWNAAEAIPWILSDFAADDLYMVPGGLSRVTEQLTTALEKHVGAGNLRTNSNVTACTKTEFGWSLTVNNETTEPFDRIVFAIPLEPLKRIAFVPSRKMPWQNDVTGHRLYKMFLLYANPWWIGYDVPGANTGRTYTDLPLRQVYYFHPEWMRECVELASDTDEHACWPVDKPWSGAFKEMVTKWEAARDEVLSRTTRRPAEQKRFVPLWSLVMASYSDEHYADYWHPPRPDEKNFNGPEDDRPDESPAYFNPPKGLSKNERKELEHMWSLVPNKFRVDSRIVKKVQQQLQQIHRITDALEEPVAGVFADWGPDEPAFGAGWHTWKIGAHPENHDLATGADGLHFCGEAWSRDQGWIEGALKTAECVLRRLGIPPSRGMKEHVGVRGDVFDAYIGLPPVG